MIFLSLLLLTFLAAASVFDSRSPPFCGNPFPLTSKNLDVFESLINGSLNADQGSADLLNMQSYGGPREWPRNDQNKVVIKYCFETKDARKQVGRPFPLYGIGEWMRALGGEASSATMHGLVFEETLDANGQPLVCIDPATKEWNREIDYNTVRIRWSDDKHFGASATTGFVGFVSGDPPIPGIHMITFGELYDYPAMVHELGHILGMAHEHQRKDRDAWVAYRCHNVKDFYTIFKKFKAGNPDATWSDLCDNIANALVMDFAGSNFVRQYSAGDPRGREGRTLTWEVADYGEPYDPASIMHYSSDAFREGGLWCHHDKTDGCTLVINVPGHEKEYIPEIFHPSQKDIQWVRKTYPWMDPPNRLENTRMNGTVS
ncbi:hypothetical protein SLS60_012034 [Paraconiothyrium brasiliense]|uniref:Metalloendopeptidase n=1 Tax=Paraconiothyrium brasiliense TaxID=300254 RepID=A0ABR3QH11_9PLEO